MKWDNISLAWEKDIRTCLTEGTKTANSKEQEINIIKKTSYATWERQEAAGD